MTTFHLTLEETIEGLDAFKQWLLVNYDNLNGKARLAVDLGVYNAHADQVKAMRECSGEWEETEVRLTVAGVEGLYTRMSQMFGPIEFVVLAEKSDVA